MLARFLPIRELQSILSDDQIQELATLLRRLDTRTGYDPLTDRDFLARLYDAYHGIDLLASAKHRRRLLDFVPEPKLRELAASLSINASGSFANVANRIAKFTWGANEQTREFLNFFDYPSEFLPEADSTQPTLEQVAPLSPPLKVLYDYQASVFYRCHGQLSPPCSRFMIQMPTGSGKTRIAMEAVTSFLNERSGASVLWLAHTEELCEQAANTFKDVWRHVGRVPVNLYRCWGKHDPKLPPESPSLTIGGFAKLHSAKKSGASSPESDLIVIDEAHMALAPTYSAVIDWAKSPSTRIVGLSATPGRSTAAEGETKELAAYFNNQIVGIETDGRGVIEFLQGRGVLAQVDREPLHTNVTFHLSREEWEELEEQLDYPRGFLKRVAENHERNKVIVKMLWELAEEPRQVLVFATSLEQSKLLCALLLYRGIPAAHVDGSTSAETRRAVIAKFRRGEIRFLFNYQVFSTGFDVPGIDVVFIARPTKSLVLYSQMIGRGMRGPAVGGTPTFLLVDVIDNIVDFSGELDDVYEYFAEYWSG